MVSLPSQQLRNHQHNNNNEHDDEEEEEEEDLFSNRPETPPKSLANQFSEVSISEPPVLSPLELRNKSTEPSTFWVEHKEWLSAHSKLISLISLDEPLQLARTLSNPNPPFTYLLKSSLSPVEGVRRRYSDFEFLQRYVVSRFPGISHLALPEKSINKSEQFLRERAKALRSFVDSLLVSPYLCADEFLTQFLTAPPAEWEIAKTQSGTVSVHPAEERYLAAVQMTSVPPQVEDVVLKWMEGITRLGNILQVLITSAVNVWVASSQYQRAVNDMHQQVVLAASVASPLCVPILAWKEGTQIDPVLIEVLVVEKLTQEMAALNAKKTVLLARDHLFKQADCKLANVHKFEVELEAIVKRQGSAVAVVNKAEQKVRDASNELKQARFSLEVTTKALFFNGLQHTVEHTSRNIQLILKQFARASQRAEAFAMQQVWNTFMTTFKVALEDNQDDFRSLRAKLPEKFRGLFNKEEEEESLRLQ